MCNLLSFLQVLYVHSFRNMADGPTVTQFSPSPVKYALVNLLDGSCNLNLRSSNTVWYRRHAASFTKSPYRKVQGSEVG
jgi:hypothetical protein